jgi:hypothetical protein
VTPLAVFASMVQQMTLPQCIEQRGSCLHQNLFGLEEIQIEACAHPLYPCGSDPTNIVQMQELL